MRAGPALPQLPLHRLVERQASRTPDHIAVIDGEHRYSYAELERRSRRLAARLRARGAGPEVLVGVCLPRTVELVTALLGILRAGAGYLPLDPSYPAERVRWVIADSGARLVLTDLATRPLVGPEPSTLLLGSAADRAAGRDRHPGPDPEPDADLDPDVGAGPNPEGALRALAYVIYTSGSTGLPKGVAIEHASVLALLRWASRVYQPDELAGVLAATSVCFDLSVFELFLPLCVGGTVVLADSALALPTLPAREQVTLVNTVPSVLAALLRIATLPSAVRVVNLAGEPLTRALADRVFAEPGVQRVLNLYGPSECTTYSTWAEVDRLDRAEPTIGCAVDGTTCHVLDPFGAPVPAGAVGELYLGGAGVARGYLGRPELTAQRFPPDPFGPVPAAGAAGRPARLYRTGDLVRRREDGALEYHGRIDDQVKVRGFRVEPGEVEAALCRHPLVAAAAVVAQAAGDDRRLVAFVELRQPSDGALTRAAAGAADGLACGAPRGGAGWAGELREFLGGRLPDYLVPTGWARLDALPLTANGKIDRAALRVLPAGDQRRPEYVPPDGECASLVADIWSSVLGVDRVGAHDDFFALGGQSLLANQVLARLTSRLGVTVGVDAIFVAPTLSAFARRVEDALLAAFLAGQLPSAGQDQDASGGR